MSTVLRFFAIEDKPTACEVDRCQEPGVEAREGVLLCANHARERIPQNGAKAGVATLSVLALFGSDLLKFDVSAALQS